MFVTLAILSFVHSFITFNDASDTRFHPQTHIKDHAITVPVGSVICQVSFTLDAREGREGTTFTGRVDSFFFSKGQGIPFKKDSKEDNIVLLVPEANDVKFNRQQKKVTVNDWIVILNRGSFEESREITIEFLGDDALFITRDIKIDCGNGSEGGEGQKEYFLPGTGVAKGMKLTSNKKHSIPECGIHTRNACP